MKSLSFLLALLAASAVDGGVVPAKLLKERQFQFIGTMTTLIGKGGKVADPRGAASRRQVLKAQTKWPGAQRVKMRYGPYQIINVNKTSIIGEPGMLWNYPDTSVTKVCTQCVLLYQHAGLEYPDGKNANIDTGLWLHHMVHFGGGLTSSNRWDPTCLGRNSLPHVDVGMSPGSAERFFSSGNERTIVPYSAYDAPGKSNYGYHVRPGDTWTFIVDLMNQNTQDITVYMTMYFEFLDGAPPSGWLDIKPVWFDVDQCGISEVRARSQTGPYVLTSNPWKPNFTGKVIGVGGHLHDGGTHLEIIASGRVACDSIAKYAETAEYRSGKLAMARKQKRQGLNSLLGMLGGGGAAGGGGHDHGATDHISSMSKCTAENVTVKDVNPNQSWVIKGYYDYSKFKGMMHQGRQSSVMAISIMYVAIQRGGLPAPKGGGMGFGFFRE